MLFDVENGVGLIDHDVTNDFVLIVPPFRQQSSRECQGYTGIDVDQSNLSMKICLSHIQDEWKPIMYSPLILKRARRRQFLLGW